ncbi:MAG: asparagine--tRNA ligase [Patescibacteria group bacterium]|jgi:asparaginyl-tRNA synthetase
MKEVFVTDLINNGSLNTEVQLQGWIKNRRHHGKLVFLDVCDSTGIIQVVINRETIDEDSFNLAKKANLETSVNIRGTLINGSGKSQLDREIVVHEFNIIGEAESISPAIRADDIDISNPGNADHLLKNRHLYIRNPQIIAVMIFRHRIMHFIREWFVKNRYIEITAPVLTMLPLYSDGSVLPVDIKGEKAYLTQCVGFYLEASVHALERVYNMGPSFRGEESRSLRHLMEYWHIKGEAAFADLEDAIHTVESIFSETVEFCERECQDIFATLGTEIHTEGKLIPFPRISYREAGEMLKAAGLPFEFGTSLSTTDEEFLAAQFDRPFWVVGIPRKIEPFPYVIDPDDPEITRTADLIASRGFGELLGVAEKISNLESLDERLREKGKAGDENHEWLRDIRKYGCVPHIGFGMGVERLLRWLLDIRHVRDTMPFPRIFRRRIYP